MNKRVFTIMIALLLAAFVPKAYGQEAGDSADNPIEINDYNGLVSMKYALTKHYKLTTDLTIPEDKTWAPPTGTFTGTLDGNGKTISGLKVSVDGDAGLFTTIGEGGIVKNLGVIGSVTSTGSNAGGIASQNMGTIQNCYTSVTVTANALSNDVTAGGIAGYNNGTIQNCYTTGAVTCEKGRAGGIAGYNGSEGGNTIQCCYATGAIKGNKAGGIAGESGDSATSLGDIENCIALNASITGTTSVGRIAGIKGEGFFASTFTDNHAAPSIPGAWEAAADKGTDKKNGADLTADTFIGITADAFSSWSMDNWGFYSDNLPTLNGFKANQPVKDVERAPFLVKAVTTITDKAGLAAIAGNLSGSYKLGGNITLSGDWTPIAGEFTGTLDGCGYTISGLKVSVTVKAGLFETIGKNGTVKNLGVTGTTVTATSTNAGGYAGGIAGYSEGTIQNCYTSVTVTAASTTDGAGGIVGNNAGTIKNCYTTGAITNETGYAGGIAGLNTKDIQYCYATGIIKGSKAGGITGENSLNTKYCIALNASITGTTSAGRIAGGTSAGFFFTTNYAALSIPGAWEDKGDKKMDGIDLTATSFTTAISSAFTGWSDDDWDFSITANLPILKGFKTDQPVKEKKRAPFLEVPVTTITKQEELAAIKDNLSGSYKLGGNITLTYVEGETWTPLGEFTGTLDGCGYTISNLNVTAGNNNAGLFLTIGNGGTVKNLGITDGSVTGYGIAGGIAATNKGTIQNCYTNVKVTAKAPWGGGIAGENNKGTIKNCYTTGAVTNERGSAGGIAGMSSGNDNFTPIPIQYCYATGVIKGNKAGGIIGQNGSNMGQTLNCIALNDSIIGTDNAPQVGRIAGATIGTFTDNHAALSIPGVWTAAADKGADKKNGADLTEDTFTGKGVDAGAFIGWTAVNWDFSSTPDLPFLQGFKTDQPVKEKKRAPFLKVPVTTIKTQAELAAIKDNLSGSYKLGGNITLSGDWTPIAGEFKGTLDGGGYTISKLKVSVNDNAGLFETIGTGGTVKNLGVTDGSVTSAYASAGSIASENRGTIQNCYTNVTVTSSDMNNAGGIAGKNIGTIQNCYTTGAVTSENGYAGGIAGENASDETNTATIQYCYATGVIKGYQAGGISGNMSDKGQILNCIALNDSIKNHTDGSSSARILGSNNGGTLTNNYAALSIPGVWEADDKGADKENGADLPETFGTDEADEGAFAGWEAANWDITTINLPTLQGFKTADQPVKDVARAPFLKVPVTTIKTQAELAAIKDNLAGSYKLGGNITLTGNWTPLGNEAKMFTGTLDGCGYTISGLNVSMAETTNTYAGLFSVIDKDGTVKNLGVTGSVTVTTTGTYFNAYVGGIVGWSNGKITNCYTNVTITATSGAYTYAGGIVGYMANAAAATSNCFATGNCTATTTGTSSCGSYTGGIVGTSAGSSSGKCSISYCYATGTVEAKGEVTFKYAGGIVGKSENTVTTGCIALNTGGITGASGKTNRIVVQQYENTITNCYASPAIPGTWNETGADKPDGADLTSANFINSDDAFTGWVPNDWRLGDNWQFEDKDFTNLPTLLTNGLIPEDIVLAGQTAIKRADCLGLVLIDKAVTYDANLHKDKNLVIAPTGNLTVNTANAQVSSLEIQPDGQVTTTTALGVTKAISTSRTLENQWSTFGAPVAMTFKAIEKAYKLEGYASSEAAEQQWTRFNLPSSAVSLPAASPYLLAIDEGSETVSFSSDNGTSIPVSAKAESGTTLSNGIFLFRTNPSLSNQTVTNAYILSDDGTRFELQKEAYTLKPFECYVIANAATTKAVQSLRVGNGTPTGNDPITLPSDAFRLWGADGQLHLEASQPADVQVYTLTGTLTHSFRLDGSRTLTLPRGIYLVRSNNITYKVSL